jgi:hypothetical protein
VRRVFLLSPASTSGKRAALLFNPRAKFDLAQRIRQPEGASIGEVFSFLSGLYFRGKLTYARAFSSDDGIRVITSNRGLVPPEARITLAELRGLSRGSIDPDKPGYRRPFLRDARSLLGDEVEPVLLGSIATGKYADLLIEVVGPRLMFPEAFVGRGDMSRGGLMLRAARSGQELAYRSVLGAVRHGSRPPKLAPLR